MNRGNNNGPGFWRGAIAVLIVWCVVAAIVVGTAHFRPSHAASCGCLKELMAG